MICKDIELTLSLLLDDQPVMMNVITAGCMLIESTATQAILFIPKVCMTIVACKDIGPISYDVWTPCRLTVIVIFKSSLSSSTKINKKKCQNQTLLTKLSESAHGSRSSQINEHMSAECCSSHISKLPLSR